MNTTVWLISFTGSDGKPAQVVHAHNCIADYRQLDPNATVQAIDCAAVAELIEADREYDTAISALSDLNRKVAEQGWIEIEHDALRNACTVLVRAQARRQAALARVSA